MIYPLIFVVAFIVTLGLTPPLIRISRRWRVIDPREESDPPRPPAPLLGGLAVAAGFAAATAAAFLWGRGKLLGEFDFHYLGLLGGGVVILLLGIYDDIKGAGAGLKLAVQTVAALILIAAGYRLEVLTNPFGGQLAVGLWGIPITIIWIVGLTNAVNLLDGLDGLACGVSGIAALTLFVASFDGFPFVPVVSIALAGACAGFLRYNFYPARVFLGDTGSLFLGFILAAVSIQGSFKTTAGMALVLPLVILLIPLSDTVSAFFRRVVRKKNPFKADRKHLHHKLVARGYSQGQAVALIYMVQINLAVVALVLEYAGRALALGMFFLMALMLLIFFRIMASFRSSLEAIKDEHTAAAARAADQAGEIENNPAG